MSDLPANPTVHPYDGDMTDSLAEIRHMEERLRKAMLKSDVSALSGLIADDLQFTTPMGQVISKADDLAAHKSGFVSFQTLNLDEPRISISGDVAVVSVCAHMNASIGGQTSSGSFQFTRVWMRRAGCWQVVVGHSRLRE